MEQEKTLSLTKWWKEIQGILTFVAGFSLAYFLWSLINVPYSLLKQFYPTSGEFVEYMPPTFFAIPAFFAAYFKARSNNQIESDYRIAHLFFYGFLLAYFLMAFQDFFWGLHIKFIVLTKLYEYEHLLLSLLNATLTLGVVFFVIYFQKNSHRFSSDKSHF